MRTWLQIFQLIADMQPGDIDKMNAEEREVIQKIVNSIDEGLTIALGSEDYKLANSGLDKVAPSTH